MRGITIVAACLVLGSALFADEQSKASRDVVLGLKPVGFWPLVGSNAGKVVDLSHHANDGMAINVAWDAKTGLADFRNAFQYIEFPQSDAYQTPSFSCGGWVFLREQPMGGNWRPRVGFQIIGHQHWLQQVGAHVSVRHHGVPAATTGDKNNPYDVLGNWDHAAKTAPEPGPGVLRVGAWQHVLFTFQAREIAKKGRGVLYLNGMQIASNDEVVYNMGKRPLTAGNNAFWWHQTVSGATGLDGSLRDLVWFDRALSDEDVSMLAEKTKPAEEPAGRSSGTVVVRTEWHDIESISGLPTRTRREVLDELLTWKRAKLMAVRAALVRQLPAELSNHETRLPAAKLLKLIGAEKELVSAAAVCISAAENLTLTKAQRAEAVLALGQMGPDAASVARLPLLKIFEAENVERQGKPTRVEDLLLNACASALHQISPSDLRARAAIGTVAMPLKKLMGEAGLYLTSRSGKQSKERDYTSTMELKGTTYKVGKGIAWQGVEEVTPEEYASIVSRLPEKLQQDARKWAEGKSDHLYRVPLYRTTPDGRTQKVYLEGEGFVLDGADAKLHGWSLFADEKGYIHLMGGQHNTPNSELYIPGSWEKMGLPRSRSEGPRQMYWISRDPESIDSFEFVGGRNDPRALPIDYLNYMVFTKSFDGRNLLFGRIDHYGWQSWGAFVYNADTARWRALGGDAYDAYENSLSADPKWSYYAPRSTRTKGRVVQPMIRGGIPGKPRGITALAWSWNPAFYNFCRDDWGVRFDRTGRMHVRVNLFGIQEDGYYDHNKLYAFSDDMGQTFFRADGSSVKLPLTTNPAPAYNASLDRNANGQWLGVWLAVLRLARAEPDTTNNRK